MRPVRGRMTFTWVCAQAEEQKKAHLAATAQVSAATESLTLDSKGGATASSFAPQSFKWVVRLEPSWRLTWTLPSSG